MCDCTVRTGSLSFFVGRRCSSLRQSVSLVWRSCLAPSARHSVTARLMTTFTCARFDLLNTVNSSYEILFVSSHTHLLYTNIKVMDALCSQHYVCFCNMSQKYLLCQPRHQSTAVDEHHFMNETFSQMQWVCSCHHTLYTTYYFCNIHVLFLYTMCKLTIVLLFQNAVYAEAVPK